MNITIYSDFKKKNNSTKRPSGGTSVNAVMKDQTSFENPSFLISAFDFSENITYVSAFDHYYFVSDRIAVTNNLIELVCTSDPMATYKSDILSTKAYVERSASNYNIWISDPLAVVNPENTSQTAINASAYSGFDASAGCFILTTSGGNANSVNFGVTSYLCTNDRIKDILNFMFDSGNFADELTDASAKTFFNPFQYILSLRWFPLSYNTLNAGLTTQDVTLGWWGSKISAPLIKAGGTTFSYTIDLSNVNWWGDFRDFTAGMAEYSLDLPCIGNVSLSPSDIFFAYNGTTKALRADYYVDYASGGVDVKLYASGKFIAQYSGTIAVDVQISQLSNDVVGKYINAASGAASLATGILTAGVGGTFSGASQIWESAKSINQPTQSTSGSSGNRATYIAHPYPTLYITWASVTYDRNSVLSIAGAPLMEARTLNGLSGYTLCRNAVIDAPCPPSDRATIEGYLNSGFYIE